MSEFALQVAESGRAVSVHPHGTIDADGAERLLAAVATLSEHDHEPLVAIDLDDVDGLTDEARMLLEANGLPAVVLAAGF